jgi:hypothetical protein
MALVYVITVFHACGHTSSKASPVRPREASQREVYVKTICPLCEKERKAEEWRVKCSPAE